MIAATKRIIPSYPQLSPQADTFSFSHKIRFTSCLPISNIYLQTKTMLSISPNTAATTTPLSAFFLSCEWDLLEIVNDNAGGRSGLTFEDDVSEVVEDEQQSISSLPSATCRWRSSSEDLTLMDDDSSTRRQLLPPALPQRSVSQEMLPPAMQQWLSSVEDLPPLSCPAQDEDKDNDQDSEKGKIDDHDGKLAADNVKDACTRCSGPAGHDMQLDDRCRWAVAVPKSGRGALKRPLRRSISPYPNDDTTSKIVSASTA